MQTAQFQRQTPALLGRAAGLVRLVRNKAQLQQVRTHVVIGEQAIVTADTANWVTALLFCLPLLGQIVQIAHGALISATEA